MVYKISENCEKYPSRFAKVFKMSIQFQNPKIDSLLKRSSRSSQWEARTWEHLGILLEDLKRFIDYQNSWIECSAKWFSFDLYCFAPLHVLFTVAFRLCIIISYTLNWWINLWCILDKTCACESLWCCQAPKCVLLHRILFHRSPELPQLLWTVFSLLWSCCSSNLAIQITVCALAAYRWRQSICRACG